MIDLHSHTLFSDGEIIPSELARRAEEIGLIGIGMTDHGDASNIDHIIPRIVKVSKTLNQINHIKIIPGIELTHVPPEHIAMLTIESRKLGAEIVIVHGETIVEPVKRGTNRAAIDAGVDILAHPGLICPEEVQQAVEQGVYLEISARKGHSLTNGHVASLAKKYNALLVINTDTHAPGDLIDQQFAKSVIKGAGLAESDYDKMQNNAKTFMLR